MGHKHKCTSKLHEGTRVRTHYDDRCTAPFEDDCLECTDEELATAGAGFQYHDDYSFSDADSGL